MVTYRRVTADLKKLFFSYPLKQRTHQQLLDWSNTVKLNDGMKGLVSEALWESLVSDSKGTPQLLLAVSQAMAWPMEGSDLNVLARDFLGEYCKSLVVSLIFPQAPSLIIYFRKNSR